MRNRIAAGVLALSWLAVAAAQAPEATPAGEPAAAEAAAPVEAPAEAAATAAVAIDADAASQPGDAAAGEAKSAVCTACHGLDGNAADPQYPKLAGQHESYTARHLALFKSGERQNAIMLAFVATLTPQDMRDLGAYYATKPVVPGLADEALKARGAELYRGGKADSHTPACMACHGPTGRGNPGPPYPALAGQHADYTKAMLQRYRDGDVYGDPDNPNAAAMAAVAAYLSDADIEALASYIEGLHAVEGSVAAGATSAP